ncbi:MAG: SUF system NifU family Fe-S cluster assembly protein [Woeseiaceae bacterium]|nr:SUF system NifU family Fe-S cluster assembly protein [Woeseiaceae bacterium]
MNDVANTDELRELYRELILDHARNPRHFGKLESATHSAEGINPLCGDKLKLYLHLDDSSTIIDAAFEGSGCAISVASASLLTDAISGVSADSAEGFVDAVTASLSGSGNAVQDIADERLEKLRALQGVREFPARVKCATLAWHALRSALRRDSAPASTE